MSSNLTGKRQASDFDPWSDAADKKKKKKSRWGAAADTETPVLAGLPTVIPQGLTKDQEEQYLLQLQIEEITRRLRTGELGIPPNPEDRSPSPEPFYNNEGKRLNTREYRTRKKLEEERHNIILQVIKANPDYKPPGDYRPPLIRISDRVLIPQDEHPEINFVGLLIGPRGNTLRNLEKETGTSIIIRGKGSVKEGKVGHKDGRPLPGQDEPLHAYITASSQENVKKASERIKEIIREGITVPDGDNDLRKQQLRELALLNGTLREGDALSKLKQMQESQSIVTNTILCIICGGAGHISADCKQRRPGDSLRDMAKLNQCQTPVNRAKMDSEYMSLMAELGQGPLPSSSSSFTPPSFTNSALNFRSRQPMNLPPPKLSITAGPSSGPWTPGPVAPPPGPPPVLTMPTPPVAPVQPPPAPPAALPWQQNSVGPMSLPPPSVTQPAGNAFPWQQGGGMNGQASSGSGSNPPWRTPLMTGPPVPPTPPSFPRIFSGPPPPPSSGGQGGGFTGFPLGMPPPPPPS